MKKMWWMGRIANAKVWSMWKAKSGWRRSRNITWLGPLWAWKRLENKEMQADDTRLWVRVRRATRLNWLFKKNRLFLTKNWSKKTSWVNNELPKWGMTVIWIRVVAVLVDRNETKLTLCPLSPWRNSEKLSASQSLWHSSPAHWLQCASAWYSTPNLDQNFVRSTTIPLKLVKYSVLLFFLKSNELSIECSETHELLL